MPHHSPILSFSFVGRLLGYQSVELRAECLIVKQRSDTRRILFSEKTLFASYQSGWLGGTLTLMTTQEPIVINWVSNTNAEIFINEINKSVQTNVRWFVQSALSQFDESTITHYPRDSALAALSKKLEMLCRGYQLQPSLWRKNLSHDEFKTVKQLLEHYPINPTLLRQQHESYIWGL